MFNPKIGEDFQFDEHIFQMGGKKPPTRHPFSILSLSLFFPIP